MFLRRWWKSWRWLGFGFTPDSSSIWVYLLLGHVASPGDDDDDRSGSDDGNGRQWWLSFCGRSLDGTYVAVFG
ncbi:hypothetical protein Hdeb2414_s0008g00279171 [Helianthus debilis subsp. tardiflorus]